MKNRLFPIVLFPIVMGTCFILIIGLAFLSTSEPQTESVVKTESVQEIVKPTEVSETENVASAAETTSQATTAKFDSENFIDRTKLKELLDAKEFENFKDFKDFENPEETQEFIDKLKSLMSPEELAKFEEAQRAAENWFAENSHGLEPGDKMPDMDMQELYDILGPAFGVTLNFSETAIRIFREQFPEGEPADYEPKMAQRIHELVASTSGDFEKVMMQITMKLMTDKEFTAWTMGQFQGKIGQQMEWMKGEIIAAGQMEGIEYTIPEDMSQWVNPLTKAGTQESTTPTQTPQDTAPKGGLVDVLSTLLNKNKDAKTEPDRNISTPLPPARIATIRETLSLHGTEAGMLHLLKNDKEAADWLLKEFGTPVKIEAWLSEHGTKAPTPPVPPETKP